MKKDITTRFFDEIYKEAPKKNYATNRIVYNRNYEDWSIDLADMIDNKISNTKD